MTMTKRLSAFVGALLLAFALGFAGLALPSSAFADESHIQDENGYSAEEKAYSHQDVQHEGAEENSASTQYHLVNLFYLNWISPDMTIYEGEDAYIGCGAVGLGDIHYEWYVSKDGGKTFEPARLTGNEHTLEGLTLNDPVGQAWLYRCIVTNGDGFSELQADVSITVLPRPDSGGEQAPSVGSQDTGKSGFFPKTGDITPLFFSFCIGMIVLGSVLLIAGLKGMRRYAAVNEQEAEKTLPFDE